MLIEDIKRLYHGSTYKMPNGFILKPQSDGYVMTVDDEGGAGERMMEVYRPDNMLPRYNSIFMTTAINEIDSSGAWSIDYIYIVQPIGKVEKNNLGWYSDFNGEDDLKTPEAKELALNYWHSVDYSHPGSLWEYRSFAAKIIRLVEDNTQE